jgi:molybdopterin synthase catalytic subunit
MKSWNPNIRVQREPFDLNLETRRLTEGRADVGAVVAFTGWCRDEGGALAALELEHYAGMAEEEISRIATEATRRWPLLGLTVVHRHGRILPGEPIVLVLAASVHRAAAFEAASFLMDYLKTRAPFWKKEHRSDGTAGEWVAAKDEDEGAAERWRAPLPKGEGVAPRVGPSAGPRTGCGDR